MLATEVPFPQFFEQDGDPLDGGSVHFGVANQNPETSPVAVFWDFAGTQPAVQPIRTVNGYMARNGTPANVFTAGDYSVMVRNRNGILVYYAPSAAEINVGLALQAQIDLVVANLANTANAGLGDALVGVKLMLANAVGQTLHQWIGSRRVNVKSFGAVVDNATDDSAAVQVAANALAAAGGGDLLFDGMCLCNTPPLIPAGVNLIGEGPESCGIRKDSTTTIAPTIFSGALVGGYPGALPANINAIVVLTGTGGRYTGRIAGMHFEGTFATPGDYESQKVEFGVVSVGSVSGYTIENCKISTVQYAQVYPVIFASKGIHGVLMESCLHGLFINNGTSTPISGNYANNCRDYGYFIRDLKYSTISGNACDFLNDPAKYPTRTRTCAAYTFRSVLGLTVTNNGDENTWGRSVVFDEFDHSVFEGHMSIGMGSDYVGVDEIAWIYSTATMRGSRVANNMAYSVKPGGLIYGGANPAKHHNIYFEALTFVQSLEFYNNVVRASRSGSIVEAGWGNDVPSTWINAARGDGLIYTHSPTLEAQVMGNLAVVYGADNAHYVEQRGRLVHVWGCMHVTVTHTTASGLLILQGLPANGAQLAGISVRGVAGGSALAAKLGWFELAAAGTGALGRTDGDGNFVITDLPTGTQVRILYDGWYSTV